jgi:hypothetical protein
MRSHALLDQHYDKLRTTTPDGDGRFADKKQAQPATLTPSRLTRRLGTTFSEASSITLFTFEPSRLAAQTLQLCPSGVALMADGRIGTTNDLTFDLFPCRSQAAPRRRELKRRGASSVFFCDA